MSDPKNGNGRTGPGQVNFNSFLNVILLAAMSWVGITLKQTYDKTASLTADLRVMKVIADNRQTEFKRMNDELGELRKQITALNKEIQALKRRP